MQPFKRKRRTRRDMVVLGGWLFADLLLGLSMLFLVANTMGSEPPEPTATPEPDYLATATIEFGEQQASSEETIEALEGEVALANTSADQTATAAAADRQQAEAQATEEAIAAATEAAMDESERATAAAESTEAALSAQATIDAISTEQASNQSDSDEAAAALATNQAEATELAESVNAQATEQAALEAAATENAASGADTQGTIIALETSDAENQSARATSDANASNAESTAAAIEANQGNAQATIDALEQTAQTNTLNPSSVTETISIDVQGVLGNDNDALDEVSSELQQVLAPYVNGTNCRIGFVIISTNAPDVPTGSQASARIAEIIEAEFPDLLMGVEGEDASLANFPVAEPGAQPTGEVELQIFTNVGCQPSG